MSEGWIYVLVNSSMPGLLKVGKTSRDPEHRATELSSVTGVATPFVVIFQQHFGDCDAAEQFVHVKLQECGFREANNREFFRARPNEVIRIVLTVPGACAEPQEVGIPGGADDDGLLSPESADDDLRLEKHPPAKPYDGLLEKAHAYYYGHGDIIQDYSEAMRLYKDAARVGSPLAYEYIGTMYQHGSGVAENHETALRYCKDGVRKGNYYCYAIMSFIFCINRHQVNHRKCVNLFFKTRKNGIVSEIEETAKFTTTVWGFISQCLLAKWKFESAGFIADQKDDLLKISDLVLSSNKQNAAAMAACQATRNWIMKNL